VENKMRKLIVLLTVLIAIPILLSACSNKSAGTNSQGNNTNSQISQPASKSEDATKYATEMWDSTKMNGLDAPKADFTGEVQDTGVVKYLFMNIKKENAEKYVQYLKDSGYITSPLEMSSTKYRAVKDGYEVIFSCSDFNSEGIGSGEIQMVKK